MGNKEIPLWIVLTQGSLLALAIYFLGLLGISGLLVNGKVGEGSAFPLTLGLIFTAAFGGAMIAVRRTTLGTLPTGLAIAAIFLFALGVAGLAFWESITFLGRGGILMGGALCGGVLAGLLGGRKRRRGKRVRR